MCAIVERMGRPPRAACRGAACASRNAHCMLGRAGLRPTRQRLALLRLIFGQGNRHVTAEELNQEMLQAGMPFSLATVYNTLNHLTEAGLLRQIHLCGRTFFDTNTTEHFHYLLEGEDRPIDSPDGLQLSFATPDGMEIVHTDLVIHLRRR